VQQVGAIINRAVLLLLSSTTTVTPVPITPYYLHPPYHQFSRIRIKNDPQLLRMVKIGIRRRSESMVQQDKLATAAERGRRGENVVP
jgi:hypothetical protein